MILKFNEFSLNEKLTPFNKCKVSEKKEDGIMTREYDNGTVNLICSIPYSDDLDEKEIKHWNCVFTSELGTMEKKLEFDKMRDRFISLTKTILGMKDEE
jgi:hypothetical protein